MEVENKKNPDREPEKEAAKAPQVQPGTPILDEALEEASGGVYCGTPLSCTISRQPRP